MHYLHITRHKIFALASLALAMLAAVSFTLNAKQYTFGSTPFFASVTIGTKYLASTFGSSIEASASRMFASAAAAFGVEGPATVHASGRHASAIPVLTYHRIVGDENDSNNVTRERFRDQMKTLHEAGWRTVSLREMQQFLAGERSLPERSFVITFDDGAKDSFYPVDSIFRSLGFSGVMYVIVEASHTPASTYYLSPQEMRRMLETGRWEIGSHSYDGHRPYPIDADNTERGIFFSDRLWLADKNRLETPEEFRARVRDDLVRSRQELELTYSVPVSTFAFPFGNETNIEGVANFPEGDNITVEEASKIYSTGFVQTNVNDYSYNYPGRSAFLAKRIHVDYDWSGERLLDEMEDGLPKDYPYEDDFSDDHGWIPSWGQLEIGRNNFSLTALPDSTSASAFLDGTYLWDDYNYAAAVDWQSGFALLLADVENARTYRSCAFFDGGVRIQETVNGETRVLKELMDPDITYAPDARIGIRVSGSVIECTWNYASVVESYDRTPGGGGIGIQTWNPTPGTANLHVTSILVRAH